MATFRAFADPDTSLRCAGTAFFSFMSLFPAIGIVATTYGLIADRSTMESTLDALQYVLPSAVLSVLHEQLRILIAQPNSTLGIGLLISVLLALWSGSRGVSALIYAMSRVREEPERRSFLKALMMAIGLTVGGAVFLTVALVTIAGLPALLPFPTGSDWLVLALRWPVLLFLSVLVISALFRWGPDRHPRRWRYIWPGALLASVLWIVAGVVFSIYVENFANYQATFGSITAAVVLLLWIYNSAQILVLGAAFNTAIEDSSAANTETYRATFAARVR
ncbi:YihY/virulence factor BrkB family protein [Devosia sp.]|uniref:YihY/virulence factor BrkB family protein n=1 Tax=Devosia sp. TaxID=1871048 RepID=UPI003BA9788C